MTAPLLSFMYEADYISEDSATAGSAQFNWLQ